MTQQHSTEQQEACYVARVYQAPSGQWSFSVHFGTEPHCGGSGFSSGEEAESALYQVLPRPYSLFLGHEPEAGLIYGPVLKDGAA